MPTPSPSTALHSSAIPSLPNAQLPTPADLPSLSQTDLCLSNAIVKAGLGLGGGVLASAILFRRRPWPVLLGLGFGAGQGYSDCERVFNPASIPGFVIAPSEGVVAPHTSFNPLASASAAWESAKDKVEDAVGLGAAKVEEVENKVETKVEKVEEKVEKKLGDKKWV